MRPACPCCGLPSEPEPGFYYGAMYVSYGIGVVIFLLDFVLFALLFPLPGYWFLVLNTIVLLVLWPWIFRVSRIIYLSIFTKYDPHTCEKKNLTRPA